MAGFPLAGAAGAQAMERFGDPALEDHGEAQAAGPAGKIAGRIAQRRRAGRALGIAIASATYLCDLEVVSIGGGLSQAGAMLFDPLQESLREHTRLPFARRVSVVPAALGQSAGLVGAAARILAGDRYWTGD